MRLWSLTAGLLLMSAPALAHWDFLLGVRNGRAAVILPQPHPLQTMSLLLGQYTRELGIEYYIDPNTNLAHLSGASIRTVWVSPNLIGRLNNQDIICASNCANYFTMNEEGHEHIRFRAAQRGIYIWDLKVVDATDINGNPVADMEGVYRIYFRAGNPHYLYGSVDAPNYQGDLYALRLTLQLRLGNQVVQEVSLPPAPNALHAYMASFGQSGSYAVVAKLDKHLSRRVNLNLQGATLANWLFPIAGDVNNDDVIDDADLLQVLFAFGSDNAQADVNGDGVVDDADLLVVLFNFGASGEGTP